MPFGVVNGLYWQCNGYFESTRPCDPGPGRNVNHLSGAYVGPKKCQTKKPPADGTSCGNNKSFFDGKCSDISVRPDTINGQWESGDRGLTVKALWRRHILNLRPASECSHL
jgi:hypothetical protein